ncbi:M57 family metalloprotease [Archangium violaceum]|uniref:M57 family metalloprotease n=1 Tax=Archangium violaceum TaxID=83451 RepID=UPI002B2B58AC|nr:M57 family metalloprotease [Archangium gephyra]
MNHNRKNPARSIIALAVGGTLAFGCAEPPTDSQEIVDNLLLAGFPADDIQVVGDAVYLGRDAEVSLAASREMLEAADITQEQYRTTNILSTSVTKICVDGSGFIGVFSTALELAIQNYDELPLTFSMARAPSSGCSFTINAVIDPNMNGGVAGFPSGGYPYSTITIGGQLSQYSVDTIEHVITHELGHTIGLRHSDYYNRSISCGGGGDEGQADIGAIHIPGTPTTAVVGGSFMNSCFRASETGEMTGGDVNALLAMYARYGEDLRWSSAGPLAGKPYCTRISEPSDPYTWDDNFLCSNVDYGLVWSNEGTVAGMRCTQISEPSDPHNWHDNYLCVPQSSPLNFSWSNAGPISGKECLQISEASDPHTWNDNFLCY